MNTATRRFQDMSAIMRELNQAVLKMQTVNDLLTMYVGAASQHALRTTFVPETAALSFDTEIVAYWSRLAGRDVTLRCSTCRSAWADSEWAPRYNGTLQPHGQPGRQSSPL